MNNRPNDWFATKLFQPDFSIADMYANGITPDNSELKPKDVYKDIPEVQKAFTVDGKFDENQFDQFYNIALSQYNEYANNEFEKEFIENYQRDPYDWTKLDKPISDTRAGIVFGKNPMRTTQGIRNLHQSTDSLFSVREIAQTNLVRDEEGNILDWTPNDKGGMFKSLTRPALALATWDEDGEHEENEQLVQHIKGEYKFDEDGMPYYEILGDKEKYGKDVLHWTDTLTIDGEGLNNLDFFDSDGLDKSIWGTVARTTLQVAPLFIPYVGQVYGAVRAGLAMSQLFPTFGKALNGFVTGTNDNAIGRTLTQIENWTAKFEPSTSDYARNHMWAFENMANLIGQVGGQLFEQQAVGMIPRLLNRHGDVVKQTKLGKDMAMAYMAGTSAQEAYSSFKEAGASDRVAGIGMLANTLALWKLMNIDYFKDTLFKGSWLDENLIKNPAWNYAKSAAGQAFIQSAETDITEQGAKVAIDKISKNLFSRMQNYLMTGEFVPRAISEGVEEVMEEVTMDLSTALTKASEWLGIINQDEKLDFGWSVKDAASRYAMSFVGGVIGGGIFQLQNKYNRFINGEMTSNLDKNDLQQLIYHIGDGRADEIRDYYSKWHDRGRFGSINLSGSKIIQNALPGAKNKILAEADTKFTQNDAIYNMLIQQVNYIEQILNEEGLGGLNTLDMVKSLESQIPNFNELDELKQRATLIINAGLDNLMIDKLVSIGTEMVELRSEIDKITKVPKGDTAEDKKEADESNANNMELQRLQERLKKLRIERDAYINGEHNDEIFNIGLFAFDTNVRTAFVNMDIDTFCRSRYGKTYSELSESQKSDAQIEYKQYKKTEGKDNLFRSAESYRKFSEKYTQEILDAAEKINKSSINPIKSSQLFAEKRTELQQLIATNQAEISKLRELETLSEEQRNRLIDLEEEINKTERSINLLDSHPELYLNTLFNDKVWQNIHSNLLNQTDINIDALGQSFLDLYQNIKDNDIILNDDSDLNTFFSIVKSKYNTENPNILWDNAINVILQNHLSKPESTINDDWDDDVSNWKDQFSISSTESILRDNEGSKELRKQLFSHITALRNSIGEGTEQQSIDNLRNFLNENSNNALSDIDIDTILFNLVPTINGISALDYVNQINKIRKDITYSPFNELFSKFTADIAGTPIPILEMINSEIKSLSGKEKITDYAIDSQHIYNQLKSTQTLLRAFTGVIQGAYDGYNESLNPIRQSLGKNILAQIDENVAQRLLDDALILDKKISTLINLHDSNNESKLKTQKDIAINIKPKFIQSLLNENFVKDFDSKFGINLLELWNSDVNYNEVNDSNYVQFEKDVIAFESKIYEEIQNKNINRSEIASKITSLFGEDVYKMKSTSLSKDKEITISAYDQMIYLASIVTINSNDFYYKLRQIIEDPEFKFAPIMGQELAIRTSVAHAFNVDIFNEILFNIKEAAPHDLLDKFKTLSESEKNDFTKSPDFKKYTDQLYFSQKKLLDNCSFIFGGAGVGKTKAIANIIVKFLDAENVNFTVSASNTEQTQKLISSVGLNEGKIKAYSKDELINLISNIGEISSDHVELEDKNKYSLDFIPKLKGVNPSSNKIYDDGKTIHYLLIDEAGQYSSLEWELISNYAINHNLIVIGLGDLKQSSASIKIKDTQFPTGLDDCFMIKSPNLTATLRANNVAKVKNYNSLNTILSNVYNKYEDNPELTVEELGKLVDEELSSGLIEMLHYENENRIIGEKAVDNISDIVKYAEKISKFSKDVVIYADDPTNPTYQALKSNGIVKDVLPTINVNGAEYEYVLVDWDWSKNLDSGKLNLLKDFYTVTQRSTQATIFINHGLAGTGGLLNIKTPPSDPKTNGTTLIGDSDISTFKTWRLKSLSDLTSSEYIDQLKPQWVEFKDPNKDKIIEEFKDPKLLKPEESKLQINSTLKPVEPKFEPIINDSIIESEKDSSTNESELVEPNQEQIEPIAKPSIENDELHEKEVKLIDNYVEELNKVNSKTIAFSSESYMKDIWNNSNEILEQEKSNPNSIYSFLAKNRLNKTGMMSVSPQQYATMLQKAHNIVLRGNNLRDNFANIISFNRVNGTELFTFVKNPSTKYSINFVPDVSKKYSIIYARFDDGKTMLQIPVGHINQLISGEYTGKFILKQGIRKIFNDRTRIPVSQLLSEHPGINAITWGVCSVQDDNAVINNPNLTEKTKQFLIGGLKGDKYFAGNNGKPFVLLGTDLDLSESEAQQYLQIQSKVKTIYDRDGNTHLVDWLYRDNEYNELMGVQQRLKMSDIARYAIAITSIDTGRLIVPSTNTAYYESWNMMNNGAFNRLSAYNLFGDGDSIKRLEFEGNLDKDTYINRIKEIENENLQIIKSNRLGKFIASLLSDVVRNNTKPEVQSLNSDINDNLTFYLHDSTLLTEVTKHTDKTSKKNKRCIKFTIQTISENKKIKYNDYVLIWEDGHYVVHKVINNIVDPLPSWTNDGKGLNASEKGLVWAVNKAKESLGVPVTINGLNVLTDLMYLGEIYSTGTQKKVNSLGANKSIAWMFKDIAYSDIIDETFSNINFIDNVFANDIAGSKINNSYFRTFVGNKNNYTTDIVKLTYPIFAIDIEGIVPDKDIPMHDENVANIDYVSEQIIDFAKKENIDTTIIKTEIEKSKFEKESIETVKKIITDINKDQSKKKPGDNMLLEFNPETFEINKKVVDTTTSFINELVKEDWEFAKPNAKRLFDSWNFDIIFVPLRQEYYIIRRNSLTNQWESVPFKSYNAYINMLDVLKDIDIQIKFKIQNYVMSLQLDNTNYQFVTEYQNALQSVDKDTYNKINQTINNYLLERLKNGEC